ncbi:hypothetical protein B484DRAFT_396661 [Ochromonadaceae sp. CCMP2298]|nr:hypothetical protein B484DRAFT_396661 [Ochromonadaceae sp. CCMP2298]
MALALTERWIQFCGEPRNFCFSTLLNNQDVFALSATCHGLLRLRFAIGRWDVSLDSETVGQFAVWRGSAAQRFGDSLGHEETFDPVHVLGRRLRVTLHTGVNRNLDALAGVDTVVISSSKRITDLQPLSNARVVKIQNYEALSDLSVLSSVTELHVWGAPLVTDVRTLGSLDTLELLGMPGIRDVSQLG